MTKILDLTKSEIKEVVPDSINQEDYAITSRIFLFIIFAIFLGLVFVTDYCADWIAAEIQKILISFTHPKDRMFLSRFLIQDVVIDICFIGITGTAFAKYSEAMFCFNNYRIKASEDLLWVFLRIIRNCLLTTIIWILFIGILQGLFWWVPKYAVGIYQEYFYPSEYSIYENDYSANLRKPKNFITIDQLFDLYFPWVLSINFSLVCIFFVRIGVFVSITKTFCRRPLNSFVIFLALLPLIFFASKTFVPGEQTQDSSNKEIDSSISEKDLPSGSKAKEVPKIHIEVHDSLTGETTTSN